jgi:hypothetical protein
VPNLDSVGQQQQLVLLRTKYAAADMYVNVAVRLPDKIWQTSSAASPPTLLAKLVRVRNHPCHKDLTAQTETHSRKVDQKQYSCGRL